LKTIQTLDPSRKCFRQVGDTLIEFTAEELVIILEETVKKVFFYKLLKFKFDPIFYIVLSDPDW
jgi:hypothetical protein